jgi:hypothetical protein
LFDLFPDVFLHIVEVIVDESACLMIRLVDEAVLVDVNRENLVRQILLNGLSVFIIEPCVDVIQIVVVKINVEIASQF